MVTEFVLAHEQTIRVGAFFMALAGMASWEMLAPRRALSVPKAKRWANNLGLLLLNSVLVRVLFPAAAVGFASFADTHASGLLHIWQVPEAVAIVFSVILLDLVIYLQHLVFHAVPLLWRLHRVHHADLDFDVTTGTRFHPIEIMLSMLIKFAAILALGPPVLGVLAFEILLNATSMFNHGNVRMPAGIDRVLRWLVVTPDMHRVHHCIDSPETNSNFGFNLPWWDRLFGTYRAQPRAGHEAMTIGVEQFRSPRELRFDRMLLQPFRGAGGGYSIGGRREVAR